MMGFTIPLLAMGSLEAVVAINLMLPLPLCRPGIFACKLTNTQLGRTVCYTITCVLVILMIAPIYDLVSLHKYKGTPGEGVTSAERRPPADERLKYRETEATSQLSGILTLSCLATLWVTRRLGLALGELDNLTGGKVEITESQKMD